MASTTGATPGPHGFINGAQPFLVYPTCISLIPVWFGSFLQNPGGSKCADSNSAEQPATSEAGCQTDPITIDDVVGPQQEPGWWKAPAKPIASTSPVCLAAPQPVPGCPPPPPCAEVFRIASSSDSSKGPDSPRNPSRCSSPAAPGSPRDSGSPRTAAARGDPMPASTSPSPAGNRAAANPNDARSQCDHARRVFQRPVHLTHAEPTNAAPAVTDRARTRVVGASQSSALTLIEDIEMINDALSSSPSPTSKSPLPSPLCMARVTQAWLHRSHRPLAARLPQRQEHHQGPQGRSAGFCRRLLHPCLHHQAKPGWWKAPNIFL